jgi:hypothetical protein
MKRVIFVGGTAFSGTTFFHLVLANDPRGLAVGEVEHLFRPALPRHFDLRCSCGGRPGELWEKVKKGGEKNLYASLFDLLPNVDTIVDSSKYPLWIHDQVLHLDQQGIASQNILIWKTPYELASSHSKRGDMNGWERSWEMYHRMYYTLIEEWKTVSYSAFTDDREVLTAACNYLGLTDFPGKERYWERGQHVLGGNPSARVHLYTKDDPGYDYEMGRQSPAPGVDVPRVKSHRSISYSVEIDPSIRATVDEQVQGNPRIEPIRQLLEAKDVSREFVPTDKDYSQLRMSLPAVELRRRKEAAIRIKASVLHRLKPNR